MNAVARAQLAFQMLILVNIYNIYIYIYNIYPHWNAYIKIGVIFLFMSDGIVSYWKRTLYLYVDVLSIITLWVTKPLLKKMSSNFDINVFVGPVKIKLYERYMHE